MIGLNKVQLIGRLGGDPKITESKAGIRLATFHVVTVELHDKKETSEWHNIVAWRQMSEMAERMLNKGSLVYIEGKLKTRNFEKDGLKHYRTEIISETITLLE